MFSWGLFSQEERHQIGLCYKEATQSHQETSERLISVDEDETANRAELQTAEFFVIVIVRMAKWKHVWCIAACFICCHLQLQLIQLHQTNQ